MDIQETERGQGLNRSVSGRNKGWVLLNMVMYLPYP